MSVIVLSKLDINLIKSKIYLSNHRLYMDGHAVHFSECAIYHFWVLLHVLFDMAAWSSE